MDNAQKLRENESMILNQSGSNNKTEKEELLRYYGDTLLLKPLRSIKSDRHLYPLVKVAGEIPNVKFSMEEWNATVVQTIRESFRSERSDGKLIILLQLMDR